MKQMILNIITAIFCVLASIFLVILTPFYFIIKFIGWVFGLVEYIEDILCQYKQLWVCIWVGDNYFRFY